MRRFALSLALGAAASLAAAPASAQDSALVRYAAELQRADHLLPRNRRDYFEPGARLAAWARALAAIAPPAALRASHQRLVAYGREYARQQAQGASVPNSGIDACAAGRATPDQTCAPSPPPAAAQTHFDLASDAQRRYVVARRDIARRLQAAGLTPPDAWLFPALN
jgi:hypothetical protein